MREPRAFIEAALRESINGENETRRRRIITELIKFGHQLLDRAEEQAEVCDIAGWRWCHACDRIIDVAPCRKRTCYAVLSSQAVLE
jgi:hypothetical protein